MKFYKEDMYHVEFSSRATAEDLKQYIYTDYTSKKEEMLIDLYNKVIMGKLVSGALLKKIYKRYGDVLNMFNIALIEDGDDYEV